ncbi:MAG: CbrC family protein [Myxococcota bacterium]
MTEEALPTFVYHPDPVGTGSVVRTSAAFVCCGRARGLIYAGPVYTAEMLDGRICPWCIADGSAHAKLGAEFTDAGGIGGAVDEAAVPKAVVETVATRTPGFHGWQQERWWTHCGDAAVFLGRAGAEDVQRHGADTKQHLRRDLGWALGPDFDDYVASLDAEGQPTAYLFRCRHCGVVGGYSDYT